MTEKRNTVHANAAEAADFQAGRKKVLVFSDAGGTGRSYHASNKVENKGQRVHYMLQPGWRADNAIQGLGRTHRTDQASAPEYRLVEIDALKAQRRFISTIARRLDQLGALTKGQRQAGSSGLFKASDNLELPQAQEALGSFFRDLQAGEIEGLHEDEVMRQLGYRKSEEIEGKRRQPKEFETPPMTQFLNRLLSLRVGMQSQLFDAFDERLKRTIEAAEQHGTLDQGVEDYKGDKLVKKSETAVYKHASGAEANHVVVSVTRKVPKRSWNENSHGELPVGFYRNKQSGQVWAVYPGADKTVTKEDAGRGYRAGDVIQQYILRGPTGRQVRPRTDVDNDYRGNFEQLESEQAQELWQKEYDESPGDETNDEHFLTGALLPIWDRIPGQKPRIYRIKLADGTSTVGRHVPAVAVPDMLKNLGVTVNKSIPEVGDLHGHLASGSMKQTATLANGWTLKPVRVDGDRRIELIGPQSQYEVWRELEQDGVLKHRINSATRFFVPVGEEGQEVLQRITASRPITDFQQGASMSMSELKVAADLASKKFGLRVPATAESLAFVQHFLTAAKTRRLSLSRQQMSRVRLSTAEPPNESAVARLVRQLRGLCCCSWLPPNGLSCKLAELRKLPEDMQRRVAAELGVTYLSGDVLRGVEEFVEGCVERNSAMHMSRNARSFSQARAPKGGKMVEQHYYKGGELVPGTKVKVGESVGSKLRGKHAVVVSGPHKIDGVAGIYKVRGEDGTFEDHHGSRLTAVEQPNEYGFRSGDDDMPKRRKRMSQGANPWQPFQGPHGGHGWKHVQTGEIRYQKDQPGAHEGAPAAPMGAAAPKVVHPHGNLGVPLAQMPQIPGPHQAEFLKSLGVAVREGEVPVGKLKATQSELSVDQMQNILEKLPPEALRAPVIVSSDGYILDGHHRWGALMSKGPNEMIHAHLVDMPIKELLEKARGFDKVSYKDVGATGRGLPSIDKLPPLREPKGPEDMAEWLKEANEHPYLKEAKRRLDESRHEDTEAKYKRPDGTWDPERVAKVHEPIIKHFLNDKAAAKPGERPKAVFLIGPFGAGKSTQAHLVNDIMPHYTLLNPDDIKQQMPDDQGWNATNLHEESSHINKQIASRAQAANHSLLYDGSGQNSQKMNDLATELAKTHDVHVVHVTVPKHVSVYRAASRFLDNNPFGMSGKGKPGRFVDLKYVHDDVDSKPDHTYQLLKQNPAVLTGRSVSTHGVKLGEKPIEKDAFDRKA